MPDRQAFAERHGVGLLLGPRLAGGNPEPPNRLVLRYCSQRADNSIVLLNVTGDASFEELHDGLGRPLSEREVAFVEGVYARGGCPSWSKVRRGTS